MEVVASSEARKLVQEQGGSLFVWTKRGRCCSPITYLHASTEAPGKGEFRRLEAEDIELFIAAGNRELPERLEIEVRGRRRPRIAAYWNGCAYVV
jgi:hypothetical protein